MTPIYICEDTLVYREKLISIINDHIEDNNFDMEIVCVATTEKELINHLSTHSNNKSLYFLDLHLRDSVMEGFELAQQIRIYDPRGYIVIITTFEHLDYLTFEYRIEAMDYVIKDKDNTSEKILLCLKEVDILSTKDTPLDEELLSIGTSIYRKNDIYSIETGNKPNRIYINTTHGISLLPMSLIDIERLLDNTFYRCHQSHIININHILSIDDKSFVNLDNGIMIPLSRRMAPGLKRILKHIDNKGRYIR